MKFMPGIQHFHRVLDALTVRRRMALSVEQLIKHTYDTIASHVPGQYEFSPYL